MGILDRAKQLLSQNADKVDSAIEKAGEFVDEKTQGRYSDTIGKVQEAAKKALADSSERRNTEAMRRLRWEHSGRLDAARCSWRGRSGSAG